MMLIISCCLLAYAVVVCLSLFVISLPLRRDFLQRLERPAVPDADLPSAAVILCVRGADPTLKACLRGLLQQDYPDLEIHIVLDSDCDPGAEFVRDALTDVDGTVARVHILKSPDSRRGLKVSAILQALKTLDARIRVIAFLDADADPHQNWLRDLVQPLSATSIGATSGVRWFNPDVRNPGSLVRAKWNLYAVSLMRYFNIAWGGSFAIRRDVLEQSTLLEQWSETICEDTCVGDALARSGYKVQLVPEVSMVNRETTTLGGCLQFMSRQLVFTRLHSRNWLPILLIGLSVSLVSLLVPILIAMTFAQGDSAACLVASGTVVVLLIGITRFERQVAALMPSADHSLSDCMPGSKTADQSGTGLLFKKNRAAFGNYACQMECVVISGVAFVIAASTRQLKWRGITYNVRRSRVTLVRYTPYVPVAVEAETGLRGISI